VIESSGKRGIRTRSCQCCSNSIGCSNTYVFALFVMPLVSYFLRCDTPSASAVICVLYYLMVYIAYKLIDLYLYSYKRRCMHVNNILSFIRFYDENNFILLVCKMNKEVLCSSYCYHLS